MGAGYKAKTQHTKPASSNSIITIRKTGERVFRHALMTMNTMNKLMRIITVDGKIEAIPMDAIAMTRQV
jgi:hypothetical protein